MNQFGKWLLSAAVGLGAAGPAAAAVVTFGTSDTVAPTGNPSISVPVGGTVTLYVWANRTGATGFVNSLGLDVAGQSSNGGAVAASAFTVTNPGNGDPDFP